MRNIIWRILGLIGIMGILYTWILWGQFFIGVDTATAGSTILGLSVVFVWLIGEIALTLVGGFFCGLFVFID